MKTDIDLVMCDFATLLGEATGKEKHQIDKGIQALLQLVTNKDACAERIIFLQALGAPDSSFHAATTRRLAPCLPTIAEFGFEAVLANDLVTLQDLVDLSCNPELLWQLHCLLVTPQEDRSRSTESNSAAREPI